MSFPGRPRTMLSQLAARHYPAANVAAVVTLAANATGRHVIERISWSYSAAPTGGSIQIEDGAGNIQRKFFIAAGGPYSIPVLFIGSLNTACIITLAAGGAGISGTLDVEHSLQP